jgi:hypothetical protein
LFSLARFDTAVDGTGCRWSSFLCVCFTVMGRRRSRVWLSLRHGPATSNASVLCP